MGKARRGTLIPAYYTRVTRFYFAFGVIAEL